MGIEISASNESASMPRQIVVRLECDVAKELFCRGFEELTGAEGFVGAHSLAIGKGWLERQGPKGRIWLCPACSGK